MLLGQARYVSFSEIRVINRYWSSRRCCLSALDLVLGRGLGACSVLSLQLSSQAPRSLSLKPNVAYLVLNFAAAWKWHTTLSSLEYAGIPYQSLGVRAGALSLTILWRRLAFVRSGSRISAIFASTAPSPSPLPAFISWTRSLIAPRSSSVNALLVAVVLLADCFVPFRAGFIEFYPSFQSLSI